MFMKINHGGLGMGEGKAVPERGGEVLLCCLTLLFDVDRVVLKIAFFQDAKEISHYRKKIAKQILLR